MGWLGKQWLKLRLFLKATSGVSTVEYALIVLAVISIVGVGIGVLSDSFSVMFENLEDDLSTGMASARSAGG